MDKTNVVQSVHTCPRLCHLRTSSSSNHYGFQLASYDQSSQAPAIKRVLRGSPAETLGLAKGDLVIEVNGANVVGEEHKTIVSRIKSGLVRNGVRYLNEVIVLVVDPETYRWYNDRSIPIRYTMDRMTTMGNGRPSEYRWDIANNSPRPPCSETDDQKLGPRNDIQQTSVVSETHNGRPEGSTTLSDGFVSPAHCDHRRAYSEGRENTLPTCSCDLRMLDLTVEEITKVLKDRAAARKHKMMVVKMSLKERHKIARNL